MSILKNYLISLSRNFVRDLFYSLINLTGLAIGLTSAFLIFLFLQDELTYDRHFEKHERIYRLESHFTINSKEDKFAITQIPLAPTMKDEFPEIEEMVRLIGTGQTIFLKGDEKFEEDSIVFADSTVFYVFSHDILHGNAQRALTEPNTMAISASLAMKYFGRTDVLEEMMETNTGELYRITAVFRDLPLNTHYRYNGMISSETIAISMGVERFNDRSASSFWNINIMSFILLREESGIQGIQEKFPAFYDKYMRELGEQINASFSFMATPLAKVHYNPLELQWDSPKGNKSYLLILGITGAFILFIAGINYMNLSTARATRRAKEVGMRKVSGASRSLLIRQFFGESLIIALAAMLLAGILTLIFLPLFNDISGKQFTPHIFLNPGIIPAIFGLTLITGFLSGIYPALYLSSFDPVKILKGIAISDKAGAYFRKVLVVVQFAISVFLIIGSLVVSGQLRYMNRKDPGFDKENLIIISLRDTTIRKNFESMKQEIMRIPSVVSVGASSSYPGEFTSKQIMRSEGDGGKMEEHAFNLFFVDYDYLEMMGIKLDTGRYFSRDMGIDAEKAFIINATTSRELHWQDNAVGKKMQHNINLDGTAGREGEVIAVTTDFHYGSLQNPIDPLVMMVSTNPLSMRYLSVRISGDNNSRTVENIKKLKDEFGTTFPFQYFFLDEKLKELHKEEAIIDIIFKVFTLLTLFIAALGLLGLSAFVTRQRTKEIGIRKVMGASGQTILIMFLKDFSKWVIIANIIAIPIAYIIMSKWLEDFYYRIEITWNVFLIAFLISMITAIITVSFQCIRAASLNPAESLKFE